jgi:cytochrome P450
MPLQIICEMMGIPPDDEEQVFRWTNIILGVGDPEFTTTFEDLFAAGMGMFQYAQALGEDRLATPRDDLTSIMMHAEVDGERLSAQEFGSFFILLVVAGNETTRNAISHGMHLLTSPPRPARTVVRRLRGQHAHCRRRDRALRHARGALPAHGNGRHRGRRAEDRRRAEAGDVVQLGQP